MSETNRDRTAGSGRISETEREARAWAAKQGRHSTEMEGGRTSDEVRAQQDRYVAGEITAAELVAWVKARHGITS